jgi:hypothetical protein
MENQWNLSFSSKRTPLVGSLCKGSEAQRHRSIAAIIGATVHSGSIFFLYTEQALFAVTARHVFEGYMRCANERPIVCQIDGVPFSPEKRLIAAGSDAVDIATFRITEKEFQDAR